MSDLHIARGTRLPIDYVTKAVAILAQRRKGKTYTAAVIAEELYAAGVPWVALDPTGAWWGLRSSADGQSAGLPVVILGGEHADVPLQRTAGKVIADLVVDAPGWYVLDVSDFESKAAERQFATDFADRFYRRKKAKRDPVHLFVDEADVFVPQKLPSGDTTMLGAFEAIVRRGGIRGIGTTLISQRAAVVNKNVLEQLDMLIALRIVGPNDRAAIDNYVKEYATAEQRDDLIGSLASLDLGEAWLYEPGDDVYQRVRIRERRTFNSSATPKPGEKRLQPTRMADVDLEALREKIDATIEKAKADDPRELRKQIRDLTKKVRDLEQRQPELAEPPEPVEVEVHPAGLPEQLKVLAASLDELWEQAGEARTLAEALPRDLPDRPAATPTREPRTRSAPRVLPPRPTPTRSSPAPLNGGGDEPQLKAGARRILETLARHHPMQFTRAQVGTLTGFKVTGGTFQTYWGVLKRAGYIDENGREITVTDAGLERAGVEPEQPATTDEMVAMWAARLKKGAREMLDVLVEAHPDWVERDDLAEAVEMTASGGTFQTYLGHLRRNGLADISGAQVRASDTLFISGPA